MPDVQWLSAADAIMQPLRGHSTAGWARYVKGSWAYAAPGPFTPLRLIQPVEKRAQERIYQIDPDAMRELEQWARHLLEQWDEQFDALDRVLEAEKQRAPADEEAGGQHAGELQEGSDG